MFSNLWPLSHSEVFGTISRTLVILPYTGLPKMMVMMLVMRTKMMMLFVICTSSSPCVTPCRFPPGGRLLAFNGPSTDLLRPEVPLQDGVVDDDDDNNDDHDDDDNNN